MPIFAFADLGGLPSAHAQSRFASDIRREIPSSDQALAELHESNPDPDPASLRCAIGLVIMASTMLLDLTASTVMPSLQELTMRSSNKPWTRYVRMIGRRGTCVRRKTLS